MVEEAGEITSGNEFLPEIAKGLDNGQYNILHWNCCYIKHQMLKILCPTCNHYKVSWHRTILGADWGRWPDVHISCQKLFDWLTVWLDDEKEISTLQWIWRKICLTLFYTSAMKWKGPLTESDCFVLSLYGGLILNKGISMGSKINVDWWPCKAPVQWYLLQKGVM